MQEACRHLNCKKLTNKHLEYNGVTDVLSAGRLVRSDYKGGIVHCFYFISRLQNLGPGALMANIKQLQRRQMGK